ncbi:hypothetical protein [Brevundimonas sp. SORGH_AS_0993]|uniref:hypothetical protein n=1 Tax=Brevundimonas sp. SORGH_AS_0993 TaxID=3041794 RepID=UPI0027D8DAAB|nr:hypothetical protein [Brevundimonas sp. SORGH_AS_0993]
MSTLDYRIPAQDVITEAGRISNALRLGGYDAEGLDMFDLARQAVARAAIDWVRAIDIEIVEAPWSQAPDGGVEIRFRFHADADADSARLALD